MKHGKVNNWIENFSFCEFVVALLNAIGRVSFVQVPTYRSARRQMNDENFGF